MTAPPSQQTSWIGVPNLIEVLLGVGMMLYASIRAHRSGAAWGEARRQFRARTREIEDHEKQAKEDINVEGASKIAFAIRAAFDRRDNKRELAENRSNFYLECAAWMGLSGLGLWLAVQAYSLPPNELERSYPLHALIIRSVSRALLLSSVGGFVAYLIQLHKDAQREVQLHTQLRVTADAQGIIHMAIGPQGEYVQHGTPGVLSEEAKAFLDSVRALTETNISIYDDEKKPGAKVTEKEAKSSDTTKPDDLLAAVNAMRSDLAEIQKRISVTNPPST